MAPAEFDCLFVWLFVCFVCLFFWMFVCLFCLFVLCLGLQTDLNIFKGQLQNHVDVEPIFRRKLLEDWEAVDRFHDVA